MGTNDYIYYANGTGNLTTLNGSSADISWVDDVDDANGLGSYAGTATTTTTGGPWTYITPNMTVGSPTLQIGDVTLDEDDIKILKGIIEKVKPKPKPNTSKLGDDEIAKAVREAVEMLK
jgi:hypothetical protein